MYAAPDNKEIFETKQVTNPTDEDFAWTFNGQPVEVPAKTTVTLRRDVADLVGKHLVNKIVSEMDDPNPKAPLNPDGTRQKIGQGNIYVHPVRAEVEAKVFAAASALDEADHTKDNVKPKGGKKAKPTNAEPALAPL